MKPYEKTKYLSEPPALRKERNLRSKFPRLQSKLGYSAYWRAVRVEPLPGKAVREALI